VPRFNSDDDDGAGVGIGAGDEDASGDEDDDMNDEEKAKVQAIKIKAAEEREWIRAEKEGQDRDDATREKGHLDVQSLIEYVFCHILSDFVLSDLP
jgi:hypothetical protein